MQIMHLPQWLILIIISEIPITNTRHMEVMIKRFLLWLSEYIKGCQSENVCVSINIFPGDGVDERDQHLLTSINDMTCLEWDKEYGKIYKKLIEEGCKNCNGRSYHAAVIFKIPES